MIKKADIRTDYNKMVAEYKERGLGNFILRTAEDIKAIHGFDLTEASGYADLPDELKKLYAAHVIKFMNNHGLNTRMVIWPHSVHLVCEVTYNKNIYDKVDNQYYKQEVKQVLYIIKADGSSHIWKSDKSAEHSSRNCEIIKVKYLRVDWKINGNIEWFHVLSPSQYY